MGETMYEKEARTYRNEYFFVTVWCALCCMIAFAGVLLFASMSMPGKPWA